MANKERAPVKHAGEHTDTAVKAFAAKWGYSERDAWQYLAQYALNRLATLARYEGAKAPKPKREKKERVPMSHRNPKVKAAARAIAQGKAVA